jgi:hypothetical protein
MTRRQPERLEQRAIVQLLCALGCPVWTLGTHRRRGDYHGTMQSPGLPDLLAFLPLDTGLLCIEVKAKGGRLRPEQEVFRNACLACESPWQVHHVVGGLDTVIGYLMSLGLLKAQDVAHYRVPLTPAQQDAQDETDAYRARGLR